MKNSASNNSMTISVIQTIQMIPNGILSWTILSRKLVFLRIEILSIVITTFVFLVSVIALFLRLFAFLDSRYKRK